MAEVKVKKSKMTLEKLALEMRRGFKAQDKKFDDKIDRLDKKFDDKLDKLAAMTQRGFLRLDEKIDKVALRLDEKIDKVALDVKEMKENSSELFTKLDKFIKLYEDQKQELLMFGAQLRRLEERMSKLENSIA